uniref:MATH domain-containing protein n=1 Tax=Ficus carica TaxID=3494 RepID=A0AA88CJR3_FICCA|nr:hypothetical protein TIFTF001_039712 [Ficus carica]
MRRNLEEILKMRSLSWSLEFGSDSGGVQSVARGRHCALEFGGEVVAFKFSNLVMTAAVFAVKSEEVADIELSNSAVTVAVVEVKPEVAVVELSNSTRDSLEYAKFYIEDTMLKDRSVTRGRCRGALEFGSDGGSVRGEVGGGSRRGALEFGPSYLRPVDDSFSSSGRFTWKIENFSNLIVGKLYSDIFDAGGYKWRILIFPKGNKKSDGLSIYLDAADSATLPSGWSRHARFSISVISQTPKFTVTQESENTFNAGQNDWGFTSFMPLSELNDPVKRYLVHGSCTVEAEVMLNEEQIKEELKKKGSNNRKALLT